ncbi:hypothetical protein BDA96_03G087500 [Sorghum bicolor]|uniref:Uncharacterized protein n=1 Tax=Sorghum bicolor TaxID=4558 RepID=A0A921ULL5_SORBI|nr:hypothetical protein BDA96_03G087500 [Sorghum bicolor]
MLFTWNFNSDVAPAPYERATTDNDFAAVEGVSIGGKDTCVIFPTLSLAFDISHGGFMTRHGDTGLGAREDGAAMVASCPAGAGWVPVWATARPQQPCVASSHACAVGPSAAALPRHEPACPHGRTPPPPRDPVRLRGQVQTKNFTK